MDEEDETALCDRRSHRQFGSASLPTHSPAKISNRLFVYSQRGFEDVRPPPMVEIDVTCNLESFRRFLINSTCRSFIPESYIRDPEVFPEKEEEPGSIYIEAADKVTLKKIRDITFINARDILGIIYTSKSGNSRLKWRQLRGRIGRVNGDASTNSLVNLSMARVITPEYVEELMATSAQGTPAWESVQPQDEEGVEPQQANLPSEAQGE